MRSSFVSFIRRFVALTLAWVSPLVTVAHAAPSGSAPALFGDGAKLVYAVSNGATVLIDIQKAPTASSGAAFRFLFPADGPAGMVHIGADAMESATSLVNSFGPGDTTLSRETSAWLSRQAFAAAKAGQPVVLDLGLAEGVKTTFILDPKSSRPLRVATDPTRYTDASQLVATILLRSADGQTLRVIDDPTRPLIVDLNTGTFRVELALHL